jgi:ligand-binding sensor domain-containing protein/serine phosphatase RsbU (regulator of sigma subunit)
MRKNKFLFCLLSLLPFLFYSQAFYFANYGVKDGLSQSNVSGIIQDSAGFYWFATAGGVSRFDGKNFVNYSTENGMADNNVSALFKDKENFIWLGHDNGMLTRFNGKVFEEIKSKLLPQDKKIYSFFEDHLGQLWIGTESAGAILISNPHTDDVSKLNISTYAGKEGLSQLVLSVNEDKDHILWFLTDLGIKLFNPKDKTFDFFRPDGMLLGQVSALAMIGGKEVLIGTTNGSLTKYNIGQKTFESIINPTSTLKLLNGQGPAMIWSIYPDAKNNLWISVWNFGVMRYNLSTQALNLFNTANGLSLNKIKAIHEDKEGNMLFGTSGEGIDVYSGDRFVSFSKKNGLSDNQVWAICTDVDGRYWLGTNEGITIYEPKDQSFEYLTTDKGLRVNNVRALVKDNANNIWIGTWGGKLVKYDYLKKKVLAVPALDDIVNILVSCLMIDKQNRLWIGSTEGIVVYDLNSGAIKALRTIDGLSSNDISCLYEQSNGHVWIGTNQKGLSEYDGHTFKKYTKSDGLTYSSISGITEDNDKHIWLGTEGGGVYVLEKGQFKNMRAKDGLLSDYITLISKDAQGDIWMGSNKGLNKYNPKTKILKSYSKHDGFTGLETKPGSVFRDADKNIWFGTVNGVYKYQYKADLENKIPPVLRLLEFKINLNDATLEKNRTLSYKENTFSFKFIGISLTNPEGVTYQYKLDGLEDDWKPVTKNNEVLYSNLDPGKYTFELKTCNGSNVCGNVITVTTLTIQPPLWKTWWFYVLVCLMVGTALFSYIKIRERQLLIEKKILEDKVTERTAEVVEQKNEAEKQRLIADEQKHLVQEKHKEITDSINYAERIQKSFLASKELLDKNLGEHFVFFQPKDVVSGDFYWASTLNNGNFGLVTADSTGHGVPGAIMSLLNITSLEKAIEANNEPAAILNHTRKTIIERLKNDGSEHGGKDGMDCSFISFDLKKKVITYAAANNPIWIVRNGELIEFDCDSMPVGKHDLDQKPFTQHMVQLQKGDCLYTLTDGMPDQFGGPKGKKFMNRKLKELLVSIALKPMTEQGSIIKKTFDDWRGNLEQVDDVLLIGTRYE